METGLAVIHDIDQVVVLFEYVRQGIGESHVIFYNKDWFDAAGVEYPPTNWDDTSWNWDAFVEKCKALTSGEGAEKKFGC
ncbi:MAG: extracellular solute-binding protein [Actinobacteria bacterium]|nr:extracellular solute-binding protein [Actinomycetota bacterium]